METQERTVRRGYLATWVALAGLAVGCTGGGESVISGVGNGGNHIGTAALWDSLADELAGHAATPRVTDTEIAQVYEVIRAQALEGDLEAALVVLKLAEEQREDE